MSEISKTADRAVAILIELADGGPSTPQQMAVRMGVNRTVVQRLLTTLLTRGFVTRSGGEYALDPRLRRLAAHVQADLYRAAQPPCDALSAKTGETVVFQVLDDDGVVVLHESVQVHGVSLQVRHDIASRSPLARSASGLAILAALDATRVQRLCSSMSPSEQATVRARIEHVRATGYARTSNELQDGVSGLAHVVHRDGAAIGSIAILAPTTRLSDLDAYPADLEKAARRIERALA